MRPNFVWKVAYKELLSTWRDRRTLRSTIILPLVFIPLFTLALPLLLSRAFGGQQVARQSVGVVGTLPSGLRQLLTQDVRDRAGKIVTAGVDLKPVQDPLAAVQGGTVDVALSVPPNLPPQAGGGSAAVKVYSKSGDQRVQAGAADKVRSALREYNDQLVAAKLRALNFDRSFLTPVRLQAVDASNAQERASGALAFIIPYFLLQFILSGAMAPAIDSTAGEKERGTLEVLLVSPVRRGEVVAGKLLATTIFAVSTAVFGVLGFALSAPLARLVLPGGGGDIAGAFGGTLSVSALDFVVLLAVALSSALLLSALLMAVSIYARSFREAQTYLTPVFILLIVPLFVLQFADFLSKGLWLYAVPLVGGALVILNVVKGALSGAGAGVAILSNLVFTLLLLGLALRSFRREAVIFRN